MSRHGTSRPGRHPLRRSRRRNHPLELPLQRRPRADSRLAPQLGHLQLCRVVDRHERQHSRRTCWRAAMIAGGMSWRQAIFTVFLGNVSGPRADASQCPCGREVRNSLPCVRARVVWSAGRECSSRPARAGGMRMVRHQRLDWRRSDQCDGRPLWFPRGGAIPPAFGFALADFGCSMSSSSCEASGRSDFCKA